MTRPTQRLVLVSERQAAATAGVRRHSSKFCTPLTRVRGTLVLGGCGGLPALVKLYSRTSHLGEDWIDRAVLRNRRNPNRAGPEAGEPPAQRRSTRIRSWGWYRARHRAPSAVAASGESAMPAVLSSASRSRVATARSRGCSACIRYPSTAQLSYEDALAALAVGEALTGAGPALGRAARPAARGRPVSGPPHPRPRGRVRVAGRARDRSRDSSMDGDQLAGGAAGGEPRAASGRRRQRSRSGSQSREPDRGAPGGRGGRRREVRGRLAAPAASRWSRCAQLERWLGSRRKVLAGEEVAALSDLVDRADLWPDEPADRDVRSRFEALRLRVRAASRRRSLVAAMGFAAGFAGLWVSVGVLAANVLGA